MPRGFGVIQIALTGVPVDHPHWGSMTLDPMTGLFRNADGEEVAWTEAYRVDWTVRDWTPVISKLEHLNEDEAWQALKLGAVITAEDGDGWHFRLEPQWGNWRRYQRAPRSDKWKARGMVWWRVVSEAAASHRQVKRHWWQRKTKEGPS